MPAIERTALKLDPAQTSGGSLCSTNLAVCVTGECVQCRGKIEAMEERRCFWCIEPMCWKCYEMRTGQCTKCARIIAGARDASRMSLARRVNRGGRPKKMRKCPVCAARFSAREMRTHRKACARAA
jgi:hypothetical protein